MTKRYLVEILFWTRTYDGDDWTTGEHIFHFDSLEEAKEKANSPFMITKDLIESNILDMTLAKYGEVIWKKDWFENSIMDYTTIPDTDYHYREYDNG